MRDYRESHKDPRKGIEYHAKFKDNPYRAMVWDFEKRALSDIVHRYLPPDAKHLDFACGTGRIIQHLRPVVGDAIGVDVSESMLEVARAAMPDGAFVNRDITRDDAMRGARFDLITAFRFFANAQDDLRLDAMRALAGLLSPGGVLVFNNHKNRSSLIYGIGRFFRSQRDMSRSEVVSLVRDAGLQIVETRHIGVLPAIDRFRPLPIVVLSRLEAALSRLTWLAPVASNQIFVCKIAE